MTETIINQRPTPCRGCPDRYPACCCHCKKPEFLAYEAEKQKIRENRRKYNAPVWASNEPYAGHKKASKK